MDSKFYARIQATTTRIFNKFASTITLVSIDTGSSTKVQGVFTTRKGLEYAQPYPGITTQENAYCYFTSKTVPLVGDQIIDTKGVNWSIKSVTAIQPMSTVYFYEASVS